MRNFAIYVLIVTLWFTGAFATAQVYKKIVANVEFTGAQILAPIASCSFPPYAFKEQPGMGMGEFGGSLALCRAGTTEWLIRAADIVPPTDGANNVGSAGLGIGEIYVYELFLKPQSSPPTSPSLGTMYADSDTNELCFFDGSAWQGISTGTDANCS